MRRPPLTNTEAAGAAASAIAASRLCVARRRASSSSTEKGLRQIIIRASIQGADFIRILAARADDDDGRVGPRADTRNYLHAIQIRQAQVQKDDIRVVRGRLQKGRLARSGFQMAVAMRLERGRDQRAHRPVILHGQNKRLIHAIAPPRQAG